MLISKAYAQSVEVGSEIADQMPNAPSAGEAFMWNMGLVLVLVVMFYVLLIRPQQKRLKEHNDMLMDLKKGDKVVTGGGLVGKIHKIDSDKGEAVIDLGNGLQVTALRSTIHAKGDAGSKPANDEKSSGKKAKEKK